MREALEVLAALAPILAQALEVARRKVFVILDGTLVRTDRVRTLRRGADAGFYSGKLRAHGMNAGGHRRSGWGAAVGLPGARHDLTAAREHGLPQALTALAQAGVPVLADKGYQGAGPAISVPFRPRRKHPDTGAYLPLSRNQKAANSAHAMLRAPGERANAQLKSWRVLTRVRRGPETTTATVHAITALITKG